MTQSNVQYCWQFLHPVAGLCGGTDDSEWVSERWLVERNALFCQWPTQIISREAPANQKALPGSVKPSIRKN